MNIFILDYNPKLSAQYHADKHMKMILESAQILSTVVRLYNIKDDMLYRPTHQKHPSTIWTAASKDNFQWLSDLGIYLGEEYTYRYGKIHKSIEIIKKAQQYSNLLPNNGLTKFAQAMPDQYKNDDAVKAYRDYYRLAKTKLLVYTKREVPEWLKGLGIQK